MHFTDADCFGNPMFMRVKPFQFAALFLINPKWLAAGSARGFDIEPTVCARRKS
jgi:hypothetical protein